jgi:hypothetical protein
MSVIKKNNDCYNKNNKNKNKPTKKFNEYLSDKLNVNDNIYEDLSKEFEFMCGKNNTDNNNDKNNDENVKNAKNAKNVKNVKNDKKTIHKKTHDYDKIIIDVSDDEIKKLHNIINIIIELKSKK